MNFNKTYLLIKFFIKMTKNNFIDCVIFFIENCIFAEYCALKNLILPKSLSVQEIKDNDNKKK